MKNKFIKILLILVSSLMVRTAFSNTFHSVGTLSKLTTYKETVSADINTADRYALPPSKIYIESCQREGLLRHPGAIQKQQILHRYRDFWVRFEIQAYEGSEWFTLCNLETGQIIHEQKLVDATY